mmetsp:Transcript_10594/g.42825  ORF Transcript_10594/g.42825 Transcript_10594/m.42825 type:complete len:174 (+) Transcript_10594:3-524(+)
MVGVGATGRESALARCSVVDGAGRVLLDAHVRPRERITDFRTKYSGVRAKDLRDALTLRECQTRVARLLDGKILVGHALQNDLAVLMLSHPWSRIRDTARYAPLMRKAASGTKRRKPRKLRDLAREHLEGLEDFQAGEHSSVDDARAALRLYLKFQGAWEASLLHILTRGRRA